MLQDTKISYQTWSQVRDRITPDTPVTRQSWCWTIGFLLGAAQADCALLVVNATNGEFETGFDLGGQTREHTLLIRSLGMSVTPVGNCVRQPVCDSDGNHLLLIRCLSDCCRHKQDGHGRLESASVPRHRHQTIHLPQAGRLQGVRCTLRTLQRAQRRQPRQEVW